MQILINLNPLSFRKTKSSICQLTEFRTGNNKVDIESSGKLLGINIDTQLSFNLPVKSASNQLNALEKLKTFLGFKEENVLINNFQNVTCYKIEKSVGPIDTVRCY